MRGKYVILSLVTLILGFILAFSYNLTKKNEARQSIDATDWNQDYVLREQLIEMENNNRKLQKELQSKQEELYEFEQKLAQNEKGHQQMAKEAEKYRMYLGKVAVKGKGVKVTLEDGAYDPANGQVNDYIVHEHHLFKLIYELYIAGASAISVNGQRIGSHSSITCNGPVITVDGKQYPAPFIVSAIGDPTVLSKALNTDGGVKDQLVNENIMFTLEEKDEIILKPTLDK